MHGHVTYATSPLHLGDPVDARRRWSGCTSRAAAAGARPPRTKSQVHSNTTFFRGCFDPCCHISVDKSVLRGDCRRLGGADAPQVATVTAAVASGGVFHVERVQALLDARSTPRVVAAYQSERREGEGGRHIDEAPNALYLPFSAITLVALGRKPPYLALKASVS